LACQLAGGSAGHYSSSAKACASPPAPSAILPSWRVRVRVFLRAFAYDPASILSRVLGRWAVNSVPDSKWNHQMRWHPRPRDSSECHSGVVWGNTGPPWRACCSWAWRQKMMSKWPWVQSICCTNKAAQGHSCQHNQTQDWVSAPPMELYKPACLVTTHRYSDPRGILNMLSMLFWCTARFWNLWSTI
jgi:hypothetical protein